MNSTIYCSNSDFESFMNNGGNGLLLALMKSFKCPWNEDLYQELSIEAAKAIEAYDPLRIDVKLTTWVWECCTRTVFMSARYDNAKKRKAPKGGVSFEDFREEALESGEEKDYRYQQFSYSMDGYLEKREAKRLLREILLEAELTPMQECIVEQTLNGVPQTEIGRELGCSQAKVSKMYHEALGILRGTNAAMAAMAI